MGRIDDAIRTLETLDDGTERALQLAGLISTLFKIKGVVLIATHQLAFAGYANTVSENPEVELAAFAGDLMPRTILEVMRGQLRATGSLYHWTVAKIPVRFQMTRSSCIANYAVISRPTTAWSNFCRLRRLPRIVFGRGLSRAEPRITRTGAPAPGQRPDGGFSHGLDGTAYALPSPRISRRRRAGANAVGGEKRSRRYRRDAGSHRRNLRLAEDGPARGSDLSNGRTPGDQSGWPLFLKEHSAC